MLFKSPSSFRSNSPCCGHISLSCHPTKIDDEDPQSEWHRFHRRWIITEMSNVFAATLNIISSALDLNDYAWSERATNHDNTLHCLRRRRVFLIWRPFPTFFWSPCLPDLLQTYTIVKIWLASDPKETWLDEGKDNGLDWNTCLWDKCCRGCYDSHVIKVGEEVPWWLKENQQWL